MSESSQGFFGNASPKLTFIFGLVVGLALVSLVGFIVLLVGKNNTDEKGNTTTVNAPTTPPPSVQPTDNGEQVGAFRAIDNKNDHIRGNVNAAVTLLEYSDLECPFCKRFHETMREIMQQYDGKVRWVYRHFPLTQLHSKAPKEAEGAECAAVLGGNDGFWNFLDRLFVVTPSNNGLDPTELPKIASAVGLDQKKFTACLDSGKYAKKVQEDSNDAVSAGGRGTPYSLILAGDKKIPVSGAVPIFELKQILDQLVK